MDVLTGKHGADLATPIHLVFVIEDLPDARVYCTTNRVGALDIKSSVLPALIAYVCLLSSIPRLKPSRSTMSDPRLRPRSPRSVANASPCTSPKDPAIHGSPWG